MDRLVAGTHADQLLTVKRTGEEDQGMVQAGTSPMLSLGLSQALWK